MNGIDWASFLLFPAIIGSTLYLLYKSPYKCLGDVNKVFNSSSRKPALQKILAMVLVIAVAVFAGVQAIRIPFLFRTLSFLIRNTTSHPNAEVVGALLFSSITILFEMIVFMHFITYLVICYQGAKHYKIAIKPTKLLEPPMVSVLVPACDEPPEVLSRCLITLGKVCYPNFEILLVENSRNLAYRESSHRVAQRYGIKVVDIANRGTKAGALNDVRDLLDINTKHILVLDADQSLKDDILSELIPILESDPNLAMVQTAQAYENCLDSLISFAAAQQHMLVYDCVMEGKEARNCTPCFGTNFVMRIKALDSVGGWDETNVTEDLTTSYYLHKQGWKSRYVRKIYAMGLAPQSLEAYWRQQKRWAKGNTMLALSLIKNFFRGGKKSRSIAFDYLWSSGFYLNTFVLSLLSLAPTIALIAGYLVAPEYLSFSYGLSAPAWIFASFYLLYILVLFFPYINMSMRGYPFRNMILVQALTTITSPIYLKGVKAAIFDNRPVIFEPSAWSRSETNNPTKLLLQKPQTIGFLMFTLAGSVFTALALKNPGNPIPWILAFWSFVHSLSLGHIFLFRI